MALITEISSPAEEPTVQECRGLFNLRCSRDSSENSRILALTFGIPAEKCEFLYLVADPLVALLRHLAFKSSDSPTNTKTRLRPTLNVGNKTSPPAKPR